LTFDSDGQLVTLEGDRLQWYSAPGDASTHAPVRQIDLPRTGSRIPQSIASSPDGRTLVINRFGQFLRWRAEAPAVVQPLIPPVTRLDRSRPRDVPGKLSERRQNGARPAESAPDPGASSPPRPGSGSAGAQGSRRGGPTGGVGGGSGRGRGAGWFHVAVAPGGDRLYLASWSGELAVWDVDRAGRATEAVGWSLAGTEATALALSADGAVLAVGNRAGDVVLFATDRGTAIRRLRPTPGLGFEGPATAIAIDHGGKRLAVGGRAGTTLLWDLGSAPGAAAASAVVPFPLVDHRGAVVRLAFDRSDRRLATAGEDQAVSVWNLDRLDTELKRLGLGP
jgi:WD40 repeat protein